MLSGMSNLKTPSCVFWGVDRAGYFGAAGYFRVDGESFPFDSGPMLSHVPKPKDFSKLGI